MAPLGREEGRYEGTRPYARISKSGTRNTAEAAGFMAGFRRACVRKKMFITSQSGCRSSPHPRICARVRNALALPRYNASSKSFDSQVLCCFQRSRKEEGREGGENGGGIPIAEETRGGVSFYSANKVRGSRRDEKHLLLLLIVPYAQCSV